jgi:hypothetical protein
MLIKKPNPRNWSETAYNLLYEQLVTRFGPAPTWDKTFPSDKAGYIQFCLTFAQTNGARQYNDGGEPGRSVMQQVNFALMDIPPNDPYAMALFIKNKAAAYWAGFIPHKALVCSRTSAPVAPALPKQVDEKGIIDMRKWTDRDYKRAYLSAMRLGL